MNDHFHVVCSKLNKKDSVMYGETGENLFRVRHGMKQQLSIQASGIDQPTRWAH